MLNQSTCVGFGYGPMLGLFPGRPRPHPQSDQGIRRSAAVTTSGPRTVDLVPIGYGFRPRLRGRLTLRGLALRRNPWTFGDRASHSVLATRVSIRTSDTSTDPHEPASPAYGTLRYRTDPRSPRTSAPAASVRGLSPVTSSARDSC
jgi:hypothetical protein